jgi:nucleoside-diphosphate-sugar epimerase
VSSLAKLGVTPIADRPTAQLADHRPYINWIEVEDRHHLLPEEDPKQCRPNFSKAQELLGWRPGPPLNESLVNAINYSKKS